MAPAATPAAPATSAHGATCEAPTYPNFCDNKNVYVIYDGITRDNTAADLMASTITANCPPDVIVHTGNQTDPTLVDQTTGQPLGGNGVTYVLGGGPFPSKPLKWLETHAATSRRSTSTPPTASTSTGASAPTHRRSRSLPGSQCSTHADQFITELVTDPMSGTLSLIGYGACTGGHGTLAAAWYYANVMLPNRAELPRQLVRVRAGPTPTATRSPNAGDTFTVLAHGL